MEFPWRTATTELVVCPEHLVGQLGDGGAADVSDTTGSPADVETGMFIDKEGNPPSDFAFGAARIFIAWRKARLTKRMIVRSARCSRIT